ncbi:MAG TPA: hypothetical protein VGC95_02255 [Chitinophagaceae bacterium]
MTPELRTACELVFQEHKATLKPISWKKEAFRGRISIGLSEMAKETLVSKQIIISPPKTKKLITHLNPAVAGASSFEEAAALLSGKAENNARSSTVAEHEPRVPVLVASYATAAPDADASMTVSKRDPALILTKSETATSVLKAKPAVILPEPGHTAPKPATSSPVDFTSQILATTDRLPEPYPTPVLQRQNERGRRQIMYWVIGGLGGGVLLSWLMDLVARLLTHH